ncbi:hypothetical protein [Erythrobacter donghaensis]|uniref:hypothetical protein n=1 Tax=Erythrobacter donghaensis TaxID=267135 RepID=UPI00117F1525|nr:hypothetical protein [Erythrobacter donghaensis]
MSEKLRSVLTVLLVAILIAGSVALTAPQADKQTETFHGVWRDGFETADFYEGFSSSNLPFPDEAPDGWLSFEEGVWPSDSRSPDDPDWDRHALFEITFEGRRVPGQAGHLGQYPAEYVAQRVIALERIEQFDVGLNAPKPAPAPKRPTATDE